MKLPSGEGVFKGGITNPQFLMHFLIIAGWLAGYFILFGAKSGFLLKYY